MGTTPNSHRTKPRIRTARTALTLLGGAALVLALTACTPGETDAAGSAAPTTPSTPTTSPAATATPAPTSGGDPAETAAWAAEAVPTGGADGFVMAQNGRMDAGSPGAFTMVASTLPAGDYSVYLACRGDADSAVTLTVDSTGSAVTGVCDGASQGLDVTLPTDGATFSLLGGGGPAVEWALAVTDRLPRAEG